MDMSTEVSEFNRVNKAFDDARTFFTKYAQGRPPADLFNRQQWTMASVHLLVVDSFQNIYKRADEITPAQKRSFTLYCFFSQQTLHHHHWFEETIAFPMVEPEFKCDVLEEHAQFAKAMDHWEAYVTSVLGLSKNKQGKWVPNPSLTKVAYNAQTMKKCIEDLSGPLLVHLQHEIDWLAPDKLHACGLPLSKLERLEATAEHHFRAEVDQFTTGYFIMAHVPPESHFPIAPWFVKKIIMPWVFYWKHRAAWQFVPVRQ